MRLPEGFLAAISRVETGRPDHTGALVPWPWSINVAGTSHFYNTRLEAIEAVKTFQQQGVQSIDVGCLQVNLFHHPGAFPSLEAAFDPYSNARYAGIFLQKLRDQTGSWPRAAAAYHSQTASAGTPYLQQVLQQWASPADSPASRGTTTPAIPPAPRPAPSPLRPPAIHSPAGATMAGASPGINHAGVSAAAQLARWHGTIPPHQTTGAPRPLDLPLPGRAGNAPAPTRTGPYDHRQFRPFRGLLHPSMPPPPHQRLKTTQNGRGLSAYRAVPVQNVSTMPYPSAY